MRNIHIRAYRHTYIHTYKHTYIHACFSFKQLLPFISYPFTEFSYAVAYATRAHSYVYTYIHTYIHTYRVVLMFAHVFMHYHLIFYILYIWSVRQAHRCHLASSFLPLASLALALHHRETLIGFSHQFATLKGSTAATAAKTTCVCVYARLCLTT